MRKLGAASLARSNPEPHNMALRMACSPASFLIPAGSPANEEALERLLVALVDEGPEAAKRATLSIAHGSQVAAELRWKQSDPSSITNNIGTMLGRCLCDFDPVALICHPGIPKRSRCFRLSAVILT